MTVDHRLQDLDPSLIHSSLSNCYCQLVDIPTVACPIEETTVRAKPNLILLEGISLVHCHASMVQGLLQAHLTEDCTSRGAMIEAQVAACDLL